MFRDLAEAERTYQRLMALLQETAEALGHTGSVEGLPAAARRTLVDLDNARESAALAPMIREPRPHTCEEECCLPE